MNNILPFLFFQKVYILAWNGLGNTFLLSLYSIFIGFTLGSIIGSILTKRISIPYLSSFLTGYIFFIRGTPFFVQLLIVYFILPQLLSIELAPFTAGIIALGNCSTGYIAEIVRSGINAIPVGQWEAAKILGYNRRQTLTYIILPQMFAHTIPTLFNEFISVILSTSIISHIGTTELTKVGSNIIAREMNPLTMYLALACLYLLITTSTLLLGKYLERRLSYDYHR